MKKAITFLTLFAASLMLFEGSGLSQLEHIDLTDNYHVPKTVRISDKSKRPRSYFETEDAFKAVGSDNDKDS